VIGAEKIGRIRGHGCSLVAMDELAYFETALDKVWRAVRPTLTDFGGRVIASTTPDGKGSQAYDFWLEAIKKKNWDVRHWTSLDNPFFNPEEWEEAKDDLDQKSFNQEHEATWESFEGLAYYRFKETAHIKECAAFNKLYPIDLCFDFNVNPTTILVAQNIGGTRHFRREYSEPHSSTEETVPLMCEDFKELAKSCRFRIFGDASGKSKHSTTGKSDYYYVEEALDLYGFSHERKLLASNPPIVDRVKYMNGALMNARGISSVQIDPSCTNLIKDFGAQGLKGRDPDDKNNLGHRADAGGYYNYYLWKMSQRQPSRTIQL